MCHGVRHSPFVVLAKTFYINGLQKKNALHAMQVLYQWSYGPKYLT
jgi:hypothetical protein